MEIQRYMKTTWCMPASLLTSAHADSVPATKILEIGSVKTLKTSGHIQMTSVLATPALVAKFSMEVRPPTGVIVPRVMKMLNYLIRNAARAEL